VFYFYNTPINVDDILYVLNICEHESNLLIKSASKQLRTAREELMGLF